MSEYTHERRALLVTAGELAAMLSIGQRTLWRLLAEGKLIEPVRLGGATRWRVDEVEEWIDAGCPVPDLCENASGGK